MASRGDVQLPRILARATVQPTPILESLIRLPADTTVDSTKSRRHRPPGLSNANDELSKLDLKLIQTGNRRELGFITKL